MNPLFLVLIWLGLGIAIGRLAFVNWQHTKFAIVVDVAVASLGAYLAGGLVIIFFAGPHAELWSILVALIGAFVTSLLWNLWFQD